MFQVQVTMDMPILMKIVAKMAQMTDLILNLTPCKMCVSQLEVIEEDSQPLKALEILQGNDVPFVRAYLLNPSLRF